MILDGDFTSDGLPSIRLFSDRCIERVLEHLYKLGHRHIDCINTQNRNPEIDRRIDIWERWCRRRGVQGDLRDDPAPVFTDPTIVAYRLMSRLVDEKRSKATAFIGTTCPPRSARFAPAGSATSASARTCRSAPSTSSRRPSSSAPRSPGSTRPTCPDVLGAVLRLVWQPALVARTGTLGTEGIDSVRRRIHRKTD